MAIDSEDGIHLAYMSNSGADLYYAYMPSYESSSITEILVDSKNDVVVHFRSIICFIERLLLFLQQTSED